MKHSNTNMPCDNYGMAACSTSCSQYYECFKTPVAPKATVKFNLDEVNLVEIIDCISYAVDQIYTSAGEIQVLCRDLEACPIDQLVMADGLVDLKNQLEEMRKAAAEGKIVTIQI